MAVSLQQFEARCRCAYPVLYQRVVQIVGDAQMAEDVLQESLLRAWQTVAQLREEERLEGWLYRTATRRATEALRKRRAWGPRAVVLGEGIPSVDPDASQAAEGSEQRRAVWQQLATLSPQQRAAFVLCAVEERPVREAAACLGISVGAAKRHLGRARARLRRGLARFAGEGT